MKKMLYLYILLQPILDIITGISLNFFETNLSLNIIFKGITIVLILMYILFFSKSKYKKQCFIYLLILFIYFIIYFWHKQDIFYAGAFIGEITYAFKFYYYIIVFLALINLFDEYGYEKERIYRYLLINTFLYSLFILIPHISGTGLYSYNQKHGGTRGWFTSANELSTMFALLIPFSFYLFADKVKHLKLLVIPISLIALALIGTKASLLSIILIVIFFSLYFLIKLKNKKILVATIVLILPLVFFIKYIPGTQIFKNNIEAAELLVNEDSTILDKVLTYTLRVRKTLYINISNIYKEQNTVSKLFGIGFNNREKINNEVIEKLIEIDAPDILFRYGIIGFIIYFTPVIYVLVISFKKICIRKKTDFYEYQNLFTVFMALGISTFAGHVFGAPSASIYLSISLAILLTINDNTIKT